MVAIQPRMTPTSPVILHGGPGLDITLLEYLVRVVLYLFAFGSVAVVVSWGIDVIRAVRSGIVETRDDGNADL
jgi:hypothetical protein